MAEWQIEGAGEIIAKLKVVSQRSGKNAMRRALRKGGNVIRDAARNNFKSIDRPETSQQQIWKNIVVRGGNAKFDKMRGGPTMRVGVLGGARNMQAYGEFGGSGSQNPGGDTWYWRLLEFGFTLPSGERYPAQSYMRKTAAEKAGAAFQAVVQAMQAELDRELTKVK